MRPLFRLAVFGLPAWLAVSLWQSRPIRHEPGVLVPQPPEQQDVAPAPLPSLAGFQLTGVARYALCARVLGTKRYWDAPACDLAPVDVALGWGAMSDQALLDQLGFSMGNRFFFYSWKGAPPIPPDEIMRHAANNHVIPATGEVKRRIKALRRGEVVRLSGWLVDVTGPGGYTWNTSRQRGDSGKGACELFYVETVETVPEAEVALLRSAASRIIAGAR
jgi:hypothetical protein